VASHEDDNKEVLAKDAMEDMNWVHEKSRCMCKINICTNSNVVKWLIHQHMHNKHGLHMKANKFGYPSICFGRPR
jgi:hypothetical protein